MVLIICALYQEAKVIIEHFNLKRNMKENYFEIYEGENIRLIISGYGKINASAAVTYLLTRNDFDVNAILNIGIAGSKGRKLGEAILVNKVRDIDTGRAFYPDVLLKHELKEGTLETFSRPVADENIEDICDMEGSAFFEAASKFLPPHKIQLIKVISDNLEGKMIEHDFVYEIMKRSINKIEEYIYNLDTEFKENDFFEIDERYIIDSIKKNLNLTEFQRNKLLKYIVGFKLRGGDFSRINKYLEIKAKTKYEGKLFYNELIKTLSE